MRIFIIALLSGTLLVSLSRGEYITLRLNRRPTLGDNEEIVVKSIYVSSFAAGSQKATGERIVTVFQDFTAEETRDETVKPLP